LKNWYFKCIFTLKYIKLKKKKIDSEVYIKELEEKIVDLSLRLNSCTNEINLVREKNKKTIGKLVHNLKNPIGVVFSFSEMILEDIEDYSTDKLEKHVQIINNSANFSIQLLNAVAKYTQLQSPDLAYSFKKINYSELLNNVLKEFDSIAEEKGITVERNFPEESIFLVGDRDKISLAIRNIIKNSFRYSKEKSIIKIKVVENLKTIETNIIDEGIGILETDLPNIFNEFYVVNTYSEDKQKCIGLGLAISKKVIQHHKGKITAKSAIDKGTNFKMILPKK
jgi:signal transduction histidine kinase